jgi:hypothetical protein
MIGSIQSKSATLSPKTGLTRWNGQKSRPCRENQSQAIHPSDGLKATLRIELGSIVRRENDIRDIRPLKKAPRFNESRSRQSGPLAAFSGPVDFAPFQS